MRACNEAGVPYIRPIIYIPAIDNPNTMSRASFFSLTAVSMVKGLKTALFYVVFFCDPTPTSTVFHPPYGFPFPALCVRAPHAYES